MTNIKFTQNVDWTMVSEEEFYQEEIEVFKSVMVQVLSTVERIKAEQSCIEHVTNRIKKPASVEKKLMKINKECTLKNVASSLNDIVGIRIICRFISDIYTVGEILQKEYDVKEIKDYISRPKDNGYRSYHIILNVTAASGKVVPVEIQIRTISQDSWASLEHQMKYKKNIKNEKLVREELKRCSDEMASTDICMQSIREFIDME